MSHFFVGVLVPKNESMDSYGYVEEVLAPYDENMMVDEYIDKTKDEIMSERIKKITEYKSILLKENAEDTYDVSWIKEQLPKLENQTDEEYADEYYYKYGTDEGGYKFDKEGNLLSSYNPESRWDWWVIGGRWNGEIRGEARDDGEGGFNFDDGFNQTDENMISVDDYIKLLEKKNEKGEFENYPPYSIVSLEEGWIEKGEMGWWGISSNEKDGDVWRNEVLNILNKYKDYNIIGVDCHI